MHRIGQKESRKKENFPFSSQVLGKKRIDFTDERGGNKRVWSVRFLHQMRRKSTLAYILVLVNRICMESTDQYFQITPIISAY